MIQEKKYSKKKDSRYKKHTSNMMKYKINQANWFAIKYHCKGVIRGLQSHGIFRHDIYFSTNVHKVKLSDEGQRLLFTPNAGGNSVISEVLSFETLKCCFRNIKLKHTEMELKYKRIGKITDYSVEINGVPIGVSVTRCMKYRGVLEDSDAHRLLTKKLKGVVESTKNINSRQKWKKQILHIWVEKKYMINTLYKCFYNMNLRCISPDTIIILSVVQNFDNCRDIFYERDNQIKFHNYKT